MTHYTLLLKKQLIDSLPSRTSKKLNWTGAALTGALIAMTIAAFVFIFAQFSKTYTAIKINRIPDLASRQFELMTAAYFALLVILLFSGVNKLCYALFENSDVNVLISMPFSASEIFMSKLTYVYLGQLVISAAFIIPVNVTFFVIADIVNAYNVAMTLILPLLAPIVPLGIASIIVLPFYFVKRAVTSRYLLSFVVTTLIMVAFCFAYSLVFRVAEGLLNAGRLASLFDDVVMTGIKTFVNACYPANLLANIMLGRELGKNFGILIGMLVGSAVIGWLIIRAIFIRVTQYGFSDHVPHMKNKKLHMRRRSRMASLIGKEFVTVLRTPGYSFVYFTTAVIMPIMAFYSVKLGSTLLSSLIGNARVSFELCTFIVILYSSVTNTFCSTSISRDGYMAMTCKTLPYSPAQILGSKMIFGGLVGELSIIAACLALFFTGLESAPDMAVTFAAATMLSVAQLALGTRLDLNHPHFSKVDDGEIKEANSTVSALIVTGLAISLVIGTLLMVNALKGVFTGGGESKIWISYLCALLIPFALLGLAALFFFIGLRRTYADLDAEV